MSSRSSQDLEGEREASLGDQLYLLYEGALVESYLYGSQWPVDLVKQMTSKLIS